MDNHEHSASQPSIDTRVVHAGRLPVPHNAPSSPPLYQASSYEFSDLDDVEAIYDGKRQGSVYGRYGGPNATHFETAIAALEGAESAVAAASGMAAINAALATALTPGAPLVCGTGLYGGTVALLENDFQQRGHRRVSVDLDDVPAVDAALAESGAAVLYVEALSNPLMRVADLARLAAVAHARHAELIVDATFASPVLVRPLALGADLVLHSVGKYIGGHGDVGAGVVSGSAPRCDAIRGMLVRTGATIPHFEAWLALRGLRTLALRMSRHSHNARAVALYLDGLPAVSRVYHPALEHHRGHRLAAELYPDGTGGIVAFDLVGGRPEVECFLAALRTIAIVHSLGEVATTISYSARSSHRSVDAEQRGREGIGETTLRLSCGIEAPADIIADLATAFAAVDATRVVDAPLRSYGEASRVPVKAVQANRRGTAPE